MTIEPNGAMELSDQELDEVAGGASRLAAAETQNLVEIQISTLKADRNGVSSTNFQQTDDFKAAIFEVTETGDQ